MGRAETLTSHLKRYDSELYASWEKHPHVDAMVVYVLRRNHARPTEPHFIFALTEDWTAKTRPREWGIEVVLNRIKAIDLWKNETVIDRVIKDYKSKEESEARTAKNSIESFLIEFRKDFAKATNHINTSLLSKTDARRAAERRLR